MFMIPWLNENDRTKHQKVPKSVSPRCTDSECYLVTRLSDGKKAQGLTETSCV